VTSVVVSGRADLTDAQCLLRPDRVLADKAYSSRANRAWLGWRATIPGPSRPNAADQGCSSTIREASNRESSARRFITTKSVRGGIIAEEPVE
jgi:hypothetical protein